MPALLHFWRSLSGDVYTADDVYGSILLGEAAGESLVSVVLVGVGGGFYGRPLVGPSR